MPVVTPASRLDADGEGRAERRAAPPRRLHHRELEAVDLLLVEGHADEAAPVRRHEVDGFGRHELGGHRQVALVLAVLVVDEDDHLARPHVRDGAGDAFGQLRIDRQHLSWPCSQPPGARSAGVLRAYRSSHPPRARARAARAAVVGTAAPLEPGRRSSRGAAASHKRQGRAAAPRPVRMAPDVVTSGRSVQTGWQKPTPRACRGLRAEAGRTIVSSGETHARLDGGCAGPRGRGCVRT